MFLFIFHVIMRFATKQTFFNRTDCLLESKQIRRLLNYANLFYSNNEITDFDFIWNPLVIDSGIAYFRRFG